MEKEYYKNLAEKYFAGNITEAEISELAGWIHNNVQLSDWWEEEFEKSLPCAEKLEERNHQHCHAADRTI